MTQLKKINNTTEAKDVAKTVKAVVTHYNWGKRKVHPYGYPVSIDSLLEPFDSFDRYTNSSKHVLIAEINGLIDILNAWIERENKPRVCVTLKNGKQKAIPICDLEDYRDAGIIKAVNYYIFDDRRDLQ